ncbi:helix-turn-helix transcriptional regulator [Streptomyces californicus]
MRRRSLLTATATLPAAMLLGMDQALADTPPPTGRGALDARMVSARELYDRGAHTQLLGLLPGLLADGHAAASSRLASWTRRGCPRPTA